MMKVDPRLFLRCLSVALFGTAVLVALALVPREVRGWLFVSGAVGIAMSVSSVVSDPRELLVAMIASLAPILGLASDGSPSWMMGPLAVLVLIGAELNAWSWSVAVSAPDSGAIMARAKGVATLCAGCLALSLAVSGATRLTVFDQAAAVVASSLILAALGWLAFRGAPQPSSAGAAHDRSDRSSRS